MASGVRGGSQEETYPSGAARGVAGRVPGRRRVRGERERTDDDRPVARAQVLARRGVIHAQRPRGGRRGRRCGEGGTSVVTGERRGRGEGWG